MLVSTLKIIFALVLVGIGVFGMKMIKDEMGILTSKIRSSPNQTEEKKFIIGITHFLKQPFVYLNGEKLAKLDICLVVKVTNNQDKISEITDYEIELFSEGIWETVLPISFLNKNNTYFISNQNYKAATKMEFDLEIFDFVARNKQIKPGETIVGIVPLQIEKNLPKIEKVKFIIKDIFGSKQEKNINLVEIGKERKGYLQSLEMKVLEKNVDLTKYKNP